MPFIISAGTNLPTKMKTLKFCKPCLFAIMGEIQPIPCFWEWFKHIESDTNEGFCGNLRGNLNTSVPMNTLKENNIHNSSIGSVRFKTVVDGKTIDVLLWKSGKIKISGGFPKFSLELNTDMMGEYVRKVVNHVSNQSNVIISSWNFSCLNGQGMVRKEFQDVNELHLFVDTFKNRFINTVAPDLDAPGRRGAFKLYMFPNRKSHISIDKGGCAQIFACRSLKELEHAFGIFD